MSIFERFLIQAREEPKEDTEPDTLEDALVSAGYKDGTIDSDNAMEIPAFKAAVDTIAGTVAALPIKLYEKREDRVREVEDDCRVELLNCDTGDTLTAVEMKRAMVIDYFVNKGGFAYVNRIGNEVRSIHYVDANEITELHNQDPIFKVGAYMIRGKTYHDWQFIRILHDSKDGRLGKSFVAQNQKLLSVGYKTLQYEQGLVTRGGQKRGFLRSQKKLSGEVIKSLKRAFSRLYSDNTENFVVLNDGIEFQESNQTSLEMQLSEIKESNSNDIFSVFKLPPGIIKGGATEDDRDNFIRYCVMAILSEFKVALDRALLLEEEKERGYFFDFDLSEFAKANMRDRWAAWANAKKQGLVQIDEFRSSENLPPLGMDYVNIGLNDVLFDTDKKQLIIPNMAQVIDLATMKVLSANNPDLKNEGEGGDKNEGGDQK